MGALGGPFALSRPAISKHVKVLEKAGLMSRSVDGRVHRCRLSPKQLERAAVYLDHYRTFWSERLDALARFVEPPARRRRKRSG